MYVLLSMAMGSLVKRGCLVGPLVGVAMEGTMVGLGMYG